MHSKNIAHRDLKPENILLENNKDLSQIKVADFGTAIQLGATKKEPLTEKVGTLIYMAPEVFSGRYDEKCDIWSCGVMLYKLISKNFPFVAEDEVTLR
jgi:calcium-dependent protein kinase